MGSAVVLKGYGAQPVVRVPTISLDGMILQVAGPVVAGQWLLSELRQPSQFPLLTAQVRTAWCRTIPPTQQPFVGLEFVGSWGELVTLRRRLAVMLGSRATVGDALVGFVLLEAGTLACYDPQTVKLAVIARGPTGTYHVRRLDSALEAPNLRTAVRHAFRLRQPVTLDPEPSLPQPAAPAPTKAEEGDLGDPFSELPEKTEQVEPSVEEALLGAQTLVLKPDAPLSESEILGANTLVLAPDRLAASQDAVMRRSEEPTEPRTRSRPRSRVMDGDRAVGFIATAGEGSWSLYDVQGKKIAVMMAEEDTGYRVALLGTKADDSMVFLESEDSLDAVAQAYGLQEQPRIDPSVPGIG